MRLHWTRRRRSDRLFGCVGCGRCHGDDRAHGVVAMTDPKTFAEQLDAAQDGQEFGAVINDMLSSLAAAKVAIDNASAALEELNDE